MYVFHPERFYLSVFLFFLLFFFFVYCLMKIQTYTHKNATDTQKKKNQKILSSKRNAHFRYSSVFVRADLAIKYDYYYTFRFGGTLTFAICTAELQILLKIHLYDENERKVYYCDTYKLSITQTRHRCVIVN